jgi:hypothetical protein
MSSVIPVIPVIPDDASEARNSAAWATSLGTPSLPSGYLLAILASPRAGWPVPTIDGARQSDRTPSGPSSCPACRENTVTPEQLSIPVDEGVWSGR